MRWSFRVARVAGIDVYIHVTFLAIVAIYGWMYYQHGGWDAAIFGVVLTLLLFFCVLLHEFGHAFAARAFGIRTPDITLLPIGGVAQLERIPRTPWQELIIAVAGPAVNVVIAAVIYVCLKGNFSFIEVIEMNRPARDLLVQLMKMNVWLVLFNMIPAFPMDGGRVLRALLATQLNYALATRIAARVGQVIALIFVLVGFILPPFQMLMFIAIFVFLGAQQELMYATIQSVAEGLRVGQAMMTRFETVPETLRVGEIPDLLVRSSQEVFPMVDDSLHLHGLVNREELLGAVKQLPSQAFASSVARKIPGVSPETEFTEALETMQRLGEPVLPVLNAATQLVGLISAGQLAEMERLKNAQA